MGSNWSPYVVQEYADKIILMKLSSKNCVKKFKFYEKKSFSPP